MLGRVCRKGWVFTATRGLLLLVASGAYSPDGVQGFLVGMVSLVAMHRPSCSRACVIFPDQGSNPDCVACTGRQILNHWDTREVLTRRLRISNVKLSLS